MRLLILCLALSLPAYAGPLEETRYCGAEPKRTADGSILRRADVLRAFRDAGFPAKRAWHNIAVERRLGSGFVVFAIVHSRPRSLLR